MKTFVLYIEHDDNGPPNVSVHETLAVAEHVLRNYAEAIFEDAGEEFPADEELLEKLVEFNEYARIYECGGEDGTIEVEPFAPSPVKKQFQALK